MARYDDVLAHCATRVARGEMSATEARAAVRAAAVAEVEEGGALEGAVPVGCSPAARDLVAYGRAVFRELRGEAEEKTPPVSAEAETDRDDRVKFEAAARNRRWERWGALMARGLITELPVEIASSLEEDFMRAFWNDFGPAPHVDLDWPVPPRPNGAYRDASNDDLVRSFRASEPKASQARCEAFYRAWPELAAYARERAPELYYRCEDPFAEGYTPFVVAAMRIAANEVRRLAWRSFMNYARKTLRTIFTNEERMGHERANGEIVLPFSSLAQETDQDGTVFDLVGGTDPAEIDWDGQGDTPWAGLDVRDLIGIIRGYVKTQGAYGDSIGRVASQIVDTFLSRGGVLSFDGQCKEFQVEAEELTSAWSRLHTLTLDVIDYERSKDPEMALEDTVYEAVSSALDGVLARPR
jgi:hypothetical protein